MAKGFFKRNKGKLALLAIVSIFVAWGFATDWKFLSPAPAPSTYAMNLIDAKLGTTIDPADATYSFYGVKPGGETDDWSDFFLIESGTDLDSLVEADFSSAYASFFLNVSATNADYPWRAYYARWFRVYSGVANNLYMWQTPTTEGVSIFNEAFTQFTRNFTRSNTYGQWNDAIAAGNFSVTVGINATDVGYAGWAGYWDYFSNAQVKNYLVFNFNSTVVEANDLKLVSGSGWTRNTAKWNTTAIAFSCGIVDAMQTLSFNWDDDVGINLKCTHVEYIWSPNVDGGNTILFST